MFILKTERLFLRHFHILDSESLMGVFGDAEVMRFGDGVQTKEWVNTWLRTCLEHHYQTWGFGPYAVVEQKSGEVIGYCGLFYFPDVNGQPEIEIGYRLVCSAWGKGYATEAARSVRDFAFNTLNIKRLIAMIDPANTTSIRVAEKIGMHYEADVMFEGYTHPDHVYVIYWHSRETFKDEPGADFVRGLIHQAVESDTNLLMSVVNLGEVRNLADPDDQIHAG